MFTVADVDLLSCLHAPCEYCIPILPHGCVSSESIHQNTHFNSTEKPAQVVEAIHFYAQVQSNGHPLLLKRICLLYFSVPGDCV